MAQAARMPFKLYGDYRARGPPEGAAEHTRPRVSLFMNRDSVYPNQARKLAAAHAIQLSHSGITRVPHGMVTATGQPSRARANCKTAITEKTTAAMRA